jgi:hypothetical protein
MNKKFNAVTFKGLLVAEIKSQGYPSIQSFIDTHHIPRSPIMKAMAGATVPSRDSVNHWCSLLKCSPEKRREIVASIYAKDEEEESAA